MNVLESHIRQLIEKSGSLPVAHFVELALQDREHGFYRSGNPIGRTGDFITAPEVSQIFGELIGLVLAHVWKAMDKPESAILLELGPGPGTLMQDALRATAKVSGFHSALNLYMLESNSSFYDAHREKLGSFGPRYINDIHMLPDSPLLLIANEFFDALPARQFENTENGWCERHVTVDGDNFAMLLSKPDPAFALLIPPEYRTAPIGTVYEVSFAALTLIRQIARHIAENGGVAVIFDYGYTTPPGLSTLQAMSHHQFANCFERPGEIDLSFHVDFSALKHIALAQKTNVYGPLGQGECLHTLGIDIRASQLKHQASPEQSARVDEGVRRLTDPSHMGTLFKAMAISSENIETIPGFN